MIEFDICTETVLTCAGALMLIVEPDTTFQLLVLLLTQLIKGIRSGCGANVLLGTINISPMNDFFCYYKYN